MDTQTSTEWTPDQNILLDWLASPDSLREPKTIVDLAEKIGCSRKTLYNWMDKPGFHEERMKRIRRQFLPSTPRVVAALERMATGYKDSDGNWHEPKVEAQKVYMEHVEQIFTADQAIDALKSFYGAIAANNTGSDKRSETTEDAAVSTPPETDSGDKQQSEISSTDSGSEIR